MIRHPLLTSRQTNEIALIMDRRIEQVLNLMKQNLHRRLSLSEIALNVNLSPSYLRQLFRSEIGFTPMHYLTLLRMRKAKELLETTFLTVKEIRFKVGAGDKSRFVQNFKQVYGMTPKQCRGRQGATRYLTDQD